jgi:translation initiation factor 6 (eIF-6)
VLGVEVFRQSIAKNMLVGSYMALTNQVCYHLPSCSICYLLPCYPFALLP